MKATTHHLTLAISLWLALLATTSCNITPSDLRRIARREAGKDDFRDSEKWGKVVTKTLQPGDFNRIRLQGIANIKFRQGPTCSVEVQGNERAIEFYDINVTDSLLHVGNKPQVIASGKPSDTENQEKDIDVPSIKVTLTAPNLESIDITGLGNLDLKDTADLDGNLTIHLSGTGSLDIEQLKCQQLHIHISGSGDLTAQKIKCRNADIRISGMGDIEADLKADDIRVDISGAGDADLDVKCRNLNVTASGTGDIQLKGECHHLTKRTGGRGGIDSRKLQIHEGIKIQ